MRCVARSTSAFCYAPQHLLIVVGIAIVLRLWLGFERTLWR
jgi:hypothetical protein